MEKETIVKAQKFTLLAIDYVELMSKNVKKADNLVVTVGEMLKGANKAFTQISYDAFKDTFEEAKKTRDHNDTLKRMSRDSGAKMIDLINTYRSDEVDKVSDVAALVVLDSYRIGLERAISSFLEDAGTLKDLEDNKFVTDSLVMHCEDRRTQSERR